MTFSEWLDQKGYTLDQMAGRLGCSISTVSRVATGKAKPSADLALAIERETDGAVMLADLLGADNAPIQPHPVDNINIKQPEHEARDSTKRRTESVP